MVCTFSARTHLIPNLAVAAYVWCVHSLITHKETLCRTLCVFVLYERSNGYSDDIRRLLGSVSWHLWGGWSVL